MRRVSGAPSPARSPSPPSSRARGPAEHRRARGRRPRLADETGPGPAAGQPGEHGADAPGHAAAVLRARRPGRGAVIADARLIDSLHLGRPSVIGSWLVDDVIIDPGPSSCLETLLQGLHGVTPRALLLTHIHLDHAGASGSLVERWPELEVYVHELGAPHMLDPSRLVKSATPPLRRGHGPAVGRDASSPGGQPARAAGRRAAARGSLRGRLHPGHASHHVSYLCAGTAFVGDVGGVRIAGGLAIPPTPPPDVDVEAWHRLAGHRGRLATAAAGHDPLWRQRGRRGSVARGRRPADRVGPARARAATRPASSPPSSRRSPPAPPNRWCPPIPRPHRMISCSWAWSDIGPNAPTNSG